MKDWSFSVRCWNAGLLDLLRQYGSISAMDRALDADTAKSHEFVSKVQSLVGMKAENPSLRLAAGSQLREQIAANEKESFGVKAPKKAFMRLDIYKRKYGEPSPGQVKTINFRGEKVQGVDIQREEDAACLWFLILRSPHFASVVFFNLHF